ncbi:MAG: hypothetical protein KGL38_02570 [Gemmatimonadota bacterium]|nr:hypothetical protein [Gemmatimonadota bacterium]MDE3174416.1 hypothetical protein [Gemmatimonadota bacterium]MDE3214987.1 hypothetical protein [Gemmatimonadota bacterium]
MRAPLYRWLALLLIAVPAAAQRGVGAGVHVDLDGTAPVVRVSRVLDDPQLEDLMKHGFPVRLDFRLELWRTGGVFNELERVQSWQMLVQYDPDPYQKVYRVVRHNGRQTESFGAVASLDSVDALLTRPYRVSLPPAHPGAKYYYNVVLEVESLDVNDLSEMERWLNGDVRPAVQGKGNPLSALFNGVGRLLARVLGGTKRNYEATSPIFTAAPR